MKILAVLIIFAASSLGAVDAQSEGPDCSLVADCLTVECESGLLPVTPPGECCPVCQQCPIRGQTPQLCRPCTVTCIDIINEVRRFCPASCQFPGGCGCSGETPITDTINGVCVAQEDCPNPCEEFECPANSRCRVHPPSGEAFCEPSCSLNNGGCLPNQECLLLPRPCPPDLPCPPAVVCNHTEPCTACRSDQACVLETSPCLAPPCPQSPRCLDRRCGLPADPGPCKAAINRYFFNVDSRSCEKFTYGGCGGNENNFVTLQECREACDGGTLSPCAAILCPVGSRCEVENGEGFCQPDCSLENGGCRPDQTCRLEVVQCVQAPCPPTRVCEDRCPPPCSKELCDGAPFRRLCSNPGPRELPGCTGPCQLSYCGLCYLSDDEISPPPGNCRPCSDYTSSTPCYKRWQRCTRRAHRRRFGLVDFSSQEELRCYRPPCPRRG